MKWEGPWMMFNSENIHFPGVVSKPNAIFIENPRYPTAIEAIDGVSPWPSFRIESFWAIRLFEGNFWPVPPLAASLICEYPGRETVLLTQVKEIEKPGAPIKFDNWKPMICTKVVFRIGYSNDEYEPALPAMFSMGDLSIVWYTSNDQRQHDQLKA